MMNSYREMKRRARTQLHEHMSEPVWYFPGRDTAPLPTTVRFHLTFDRIGELLRSGFGERMETTPKMIFLHPPGIPPRNAIVVTKDMGVYRVDHSYPPDDITVTVEVVELSDSQITGEGLALGEPWAGLGEPIVEEA